MQAGVGLLDTDVIHIFMIIALDIAITLRFSINCSRVICSPIVLFAILRESTSETYGPGSIFHHISFRSTILQSFTFRSLNQKYQKYLLYLLFRFMYLYQISLLQVTVKGLTTPLSRWVQAVWLVMKVLVICVLSPTRLIPWFSNWGKYLFLLCCTTLSSSREKPTQAQEVAGRVSGAVAGEIYIKPTKYPSKLSSLALHYLPFSSHFPVPHF